MMKTVPPATAEAVERYLGSGLIKGIGPIPAKKHADGGEAAAQFSENRVTLIRFTRSASCDALFPALGPRRHYSVPLSATRSARRRYQRSRYPPGTSGC